MLTVGPADLVGLPGKRLWPAQRLRHVHDTAGLKDVDWSWRCSRSRWRQRQFGLVLCELSPRHFVPGREHGSGHLVRAVGRAALAAKGVGLKIDVFEAVERDLGGNVDRLRDRAVDVP